MIDYIIQNLWILWLTLSFVCLISELTGGDLYFVCFSIGALFSLVLAAVGLPFWSQVLLWAVASLLCVLLVRPPLLRKLHSGGDERKSNADALIGRDAKVIELIPVGGSGYVKIDGDEWRAVSDEQTDIPVVSTVTVVSRDSIILKVKPNGVV